MSQWLAWSHGDGSSDQKLLSSRWAAGISVAGQSSGVSASPVRSESGAPLPPKGACLEHRQHRYCL